MILVLNGIRRVKNLELAIKSSFLLFTAKKMDELLLTNLANRA
jgi:hypothetical protein